MEAKYIVNRAGDICEIIQSVHGMIQYRSDAIVKSGSIVINSNVSMNLHKNKESEHDILLIATKETHPELYL